MRDHVSRVAQVCFFHFRRLRPMRARLGRDVTLTLVTSLVLSRLDYCNSVLAGLPASILAPLQRVLHAAARLVNGLRPHDHVSSTLKELHWLPIKQIVSPGAQSGGRPCAIVPDWYADCSHRCPIVVYSSSCVQRRLCRPPRTRLKFGERAFSVAAPHPQAWNRLPTELKLMRSTPTFKRSLKTFFFQTA